MRLSGSVVRILPQDDDPYIFKGSGIHRRQPGSTTLAGVEDQDQQREDRGDAHDPHDGLYGHRVLVKLRVPGQAAHLEDVPDRGDLALARLDEGETQGLGLVDRGTEETGDLLASRLAGSKRAGHLL